MNNQQFRRLVLDTPARQQDGASGTPRPQTGAATLGSRSRSSIPMTPRTVKGSTGIDFARQLAERNAASQPQKKFRSSAAPKGSKLAAGYRDRTLDRVDDEADDKARRIKALEESMKLGQIDRDTFEKLRDDITGGDVSATHLVKGLDRKLLERVRRGEDVLGGAPQRDDPDKSPEPDVDEEFDKLEEKEVAPVAREKTVKRGEMAPPPPVAGTKRTRDAILAELKASRQAAAEAKAAAQPQLGSKFRKIGEKRETSRIERDVRGREVLITVDADGSVKRKVRKARPEEQTAPTGLLMPDKGVKPLGMEVPDIPPAPPAEEEDDDIFEGIGTSYNPLGDLDNSATSSSDDGDEDGEPKAPSKQRAPPLPPDEGTPATAAPPSPTQPSATQPAQPRNYFNDTPSTTITPSGPTSALTDPAILAALKKVRTLPTTTTTTTTITAPPSDAADADEHDPEREARLQRRAAMLAGADRDLEDVDLGFGESRFEDVEDLEEGGGKLRLSEWRGAGGAAEDGDEGARGGGKKRKRGPKKRKGDKDSAADVLRVIERRKEGGG